MDEVVKLLKSIEKKLIINNALLEHIVNFQSCNLICSGDYLEYDHRDNCELKVN